MKTHQKRLLVTAGAAWAAALLVYRFTRRRYSGIKLKKSILIDRPASELYAYWRNLKNLPRVSGILECVEIVDGTRSRWTAKGPGGIRGHWDVEITRDL